jgi:hypothetical protein
MKISLEELETLTPDEDTPADVRLSVTAAELRAPTALIPAAREIESVFGSYLPEGCSADR